MGDQITIVLDLETTCNGGLAPDLSPKACYDANRILLGGALYSHLEHRDYTYGEKGGAHKLTTWLDYLRCRNKYDDCTIVGHFLQFDLAYLMREAAKEKIDINWAKFKYWDTARAEYLASGHTKGFPSLEDTCEAYGIPYTKSIDIGAWLKAGHKMEDIGKNDLVKYLQEDIANTEKLYEAQQKAIPSSMRDFIFSQCQDLPAIAAMELNGIAFDWKNAWGESEKIEKRVTEIEGEILGIIDTQYPMMDTSLLNVTSNRTISAVLTGVPDIITVGKKKKDKKPLIFNEPLIDKKSVLHKVIWGTEKPNPDLGYSVDEDHLSTLVTHSGPMYAYHQIAKLILEHRGLNKTVNTYLLPLCQRAYTNQPSCKVYTNINLMVTRTGRTSSSDPNFQNMPPNIRKYFHADSPDELLVELDFKQLEVCAVADLSGCPVLINDLTTGRDVHYEIGKNVCGWKTPADQTEETRRVIKSVVFGLLYGGGPKTLAEQSGVDSAQVKAIINAFYERYPGVKSWHDGLLEEAELGKWLTDKPAEGGRLLNDSIIRIEKTGRIFRLTEEKAPAWTGKDYSFKPTKIKNYKAQGYAGGDIVLTFLKTLFTMLGGYTSSVQLKNLIHDSVLLQVPKTKLDETMRIVEAATKYTEELLTLQVPLKIEMKSANYYWTKEEQQ